MKTFILLFAIALLPISVAAQQQFSCSYGDRGACLGYGDTICSSSGKCVSEQASCFDRYQCDYEGFTCKSNVTACTNEYEGLLSRFNSLVNDYNRLLDDSREVRDSFESTLDELKRTRQEFGAVVDDLRRSEDTLTELRACIEGLGRLDDPALCLH